MCLFLIVTSLASPSVISSRYERSECRGRKVFDPDQQNKREEKLTTHALSFHFFSSDCKVVAKEWLSLHTPKYISSPRSLVINHIAPLAWALKDGAKNCPKLNEIKFVSDLENPMSASSNANGSKKPQVFLQWLQRSNIKRSTCAYFLLIINKHRFTFGERDQLMAEVVVDNCR